MSKKIAFFIDSLKSSGGAFQEAQYYMIEEIRKNTEEFEIVIVSPNEIKIDKIETLKIKP